ncbi:MAG TPA: response regulator [Allosphingosinicella sp.]|jgi:signal transduction histidine kinase/ActR/RegA family two-component response regulator
MEERVLLLALRGRDAEVIEQLLSRQGTDGSRCDSVAALARHLAAGAGSAIVTEESLAGSDCGDLFAWLREQPSWSDFPFILLATKRSGLRPREARETLEKLGNVVVLERPIHSETLTRAVASALRARARQYEARRHLEELKRAEERLLQLNATLEERIGQRTAELSAANNRLMQEISERERAQAALVQAQKMEALGQLTGGIAHDFNNLLTVVAGNLDLIRRRGGDAQTIRQAGFAAEAAARAAKLTHQLLAFSRIQKLDLRPVDLNALIEGMTDLLERTIGPDVRIELALAPGPLWAMADANQLELAVLNLVINARDAMPSGGAVTVSSGTIEDGGEGKSGPFGVVGVRDTGAGIPPHLVDRVFDPFFTTKAIGKGTGLGLSQVYGIARQSGGTVRLASEEGRGTTVSILLPLTFAPPLLARDAPTPALAKSDTLRRVLVIEDEEGVRRFLVECLEMLGFTAVQAANGREGLERLDEARPDLMIVDFAMPDMNGADVMAAARDRFPALPIILATGYADMDAVERAARADRVIRKPFRIEELSAAIEAALSDAVSSNNDKCLDVGR